MLLITIGVSLLGIYQAAACLPNFAGGSQCDDEVATDYACKLLDLAKGGQIVLWKRHPSGVSDNAYAYNNIQDACNGREASRSKYTCAECPDPGAPGGSVCLKRSILEYIYKVYRKVGWIHVNEVAGACHSCHSKHYQGRAVDLHRDATNMGAMQRICESMLGLFLNETTHYHCQI